MRKNIAILFALLSTWTFGQCATGQMQYKIKTSSGWTEKCLSIGSAGLLLNTASAGTLGTVSQATFALDADLDLESTNRQGADDVLQDNITAEAALRATADAAKSDTGHTHVCADITDASTGGNTDSDRDLLAKYNSEGQLRASVINSSTPAIWGSSTGTGYAGFFSGGSANIRMVTPVAGIEASSDAVVLDAARINSGKVAHFGGLAGTGMDISDAGVCTWTSATGASGTRTGLGLGTIATQNANNVTISGGSVSGITDLAVTDGGTGASDASTARTNLGLGTIATQASSNVSITGGSVTGITDLAIADGGTGASTASAALTNLGITRVKITSDVTNSTTSFADATGLSFALEANTTYSFVFHVLVTTPATTQGYSISINGPTSPTAFSYQSMQPLTNTTQTPSHQTAYNTGTSGTSAPSGTFVVVIPGQIVTGANSGTLIVRFLSETAGQTVTVKAGSTGTLTVFP